MRLIATFLLGLLAASAAIAQKTATVTASYRYYAPPTMAPAVARQSAIEAAQLDAIAREFGSSLSMQNYTFVRAEASAETEEFMMFGESDVRGEWIETLGDTTVTITPGQNEFIYDVKLKGRIREIAGQHIELESQVLFNGTDPQHDRVRNFTFHSGDYMYLYFKSPVDGYLAVYLGDDDAAHTMQCLLPYRKQTEGAYPIKANREYIFFSRDTADDEYRPMAGRIKMRSRTARDANRLYVIFSPNQFAKAPDADSRAPGAKAYDTHGNAIDLLPRQTDFGRFQKWLGKCRRRDPAMQVQKTILFIEQPR